MDRGSQEQRSVPCLFDQDEICLPSPFARRDLVSCQNAMRYIESCCVETGNKVRLQKLYWQLLAHCLTSREGCDYDIQRGYDLRKEIEEHLPVAIQVPKPDVLAVTAFAKLTGCLTNQAQEVLPGLFIGNSEPAKTEWCLEHGVDHVVRCFDSARYELIAQRDVEYAAHHIELLEVPLDDNKEQELISHLPTALDFISAGLYSRWEKGSGGVLIHCGAGISRSAAITAAYIMATLRCNYHRALAVIRSRRPIVGPNAGFSKQLKEWEETAMGAVPLLKHAAVG